MRTYRACWNLLVFVITGISLMLGWLTEGPWLILVEVIAVGITGIALGACWEDDPARRWRVGRTWALRGIVTAIVLIGLPHLIGPWSLIVLVALGALSPAVVLAAARYGRGRREAAAGGVLKGLPDDELARRWRSSSIAVRSSWRTPAEVLALVLERQRLLDELEVRDPEAFMRWLVAAGWRESPSR